MLRAGVSLLHEVRCRGLWGRLREGGQPAVGVVVMVVVVAVVMRGRRESRFLRSEVSVLGTIQKQILDWLAEDIYTSPAYASCCARQAMTRAAPWCPRCCCCLRAPWPRRPSGPPPPPRRRYRPRRRRGRPPRPWWPPWPPELPAASTALDPTW